MTSRGIPHLTPVGVLCILRSRLTTNVPNDVLELLRARVDTFEKLELVVKLHDAPLSTMSVDEVCRALKLSREVVRQAAIELRASTLLEMTVRGELRLVPVEASDRESVDALVRLYNTDPLVIVKALGEISMDRIRNMATRAFAEAFVIRRAPDDD